MLTPNFGAERGLIGAAGFPEPCPIIGNVMLCCREGIPKICASAAKRDARALMLFMLMVNTAR